MSARDTAVYWIEYVIRHRGASHLQYPAIHQNFIQQNSLDVIAFLLGAAYFIIKIIFYVFNLIFKRVDNVKKNQ